LRFSEAALDGRDTDHPDREADLDPVWIDGPSRSPAERGA
jgi:hypothetical protein